MAGLCQPLVAQAAEAPAIDVEEIVVTAERTNRSLRDTATSVQVMTAEDIARAAGIQSIYDVLGDIPNVVANRTANNAPAVRGIDGGGPAIGANAFFAGTRPRVNFMVDGRALTFNEAIYLDGGIWDAQQIEVYRGPQSTLQGRNAIGGVIAIKTADPTFDWHGKARFILGEDNLRQTSAAVGGPLVGDTLAFRVSGDYRAEDAYITVYPYPQLPHPGHYAEQTYRGKLLFTPNSLDNFRSLLTVSYTDAFAPQTLSVKKPFDSFLSSTTNTPRFRTRALVGISDTTWQMTDGLGLSTYLTASDFKVNRYVNTGGGIAQIDGSEYTAEPRLRFGNSSDQISAFIAPYLFYSHQKEAIDLFGGGKFKDSTLTWAVFGEATWRPSSLFDLTFGSRYEKENRDRSGGTGPFLINYHRSFDAFLPRATASLHTSPQTTWGVTVGRGYNSGGAGFAFNPPFPSFTYEKETVWNYEAFVRTSFFDDRMKVRANIFYNDYRGLQLPFDVAQNPSAPATIIRNAEKGTTYGAEVEARFTVHEGLDLKASGGLLQTKVNRYTDPSVQGRDLPRSPAFQFSAGVYAAPIRNVDVSADVRYTDSYYSDVFNNARGKTDPYAEVNAQAGYRIGFARLFVSVTNLFNTHTPVLLTPVANPANDIASMNRPRRFMGGIEAAF